MRLPDGFLDELRARTPLASVIGRRVKLARSGRQWKGCCPFHNEKSPSFYVYDDGYKCFGCGVHGDAVGFVMASQGLTFMEAVDLLAGEAGLDVPKPTPEAAEAEKRRLGLHAVMNLAAEAFQRRLHLPEGATGLAYLRQRGLTDETIARFGLGWSGEGRGALAADLAREGVSVAILVEVGLMREAEEGRPPYDLFRHRVMFPIRDRRGRVISFGGRILDDGQPKYVNGPETPLYSKRRTLFGLNFAHEAARKGAAVVTVEGYMDVIALHQAGFAGAVAPLGTALTDEQLAELWQLSPVPILCFDGDAAGGRAALRAADLALPQLTPERSLRLATLPAGEDPDSLVKRQGPAGFQAVLDTARPISMALYGLMAEGSGPSPEQRAGLRTRLEAAAARVENKSLASELRRVLLDEFFASRPPSGRAPRNAGGFGRAATPARRFPAPHRPTPGPGPARDEQARILVAILLRHPALLPQFEEAFSTIKLPSTLESLQHAVLRWQATASELDSGALITHLTKIGLAAQAAQALSAVPVPLPVCARATAMPAEAAEGWWHFFGLLEPDRLEAEIAQATRDLANAPDDSAQHAAERRLVALCTARETLRSGGTWDDPSAG
jgi:DNA primase